MPVMESERGLRPIRSRSRAQRLALRDHRLTGVVRTWCLLYWLCGLTPPRLGGTLRLEAFAMAERGLYEWGMFCGGF